MHYSEPFYITWGVSYTYIIEIAKLTDADKIFKFFKRTASDVFQMCNIQFIQHIKSIFACHDILISVKSNNSPQYSSDEYKKFSSKWGFKRM